MPLAVLLDSAAAISPADMRVGALGMATGAGAVDPPESAIGAPVASVGSGCGATRVSGEAQAATPASAGNSIRNLDGIGIWHLGRWEWYDRPTHLSGVR